MSVSFISGADGHLGRALARWLLEHTASDLLLYARAADDAERQAKHTALAEFNDNSRCRLIFGDLRDDKPFARIDRAGIASILHCAAVTDFGVEKETARAVNIDGTRKMADFATACPDLQCFALLSSLYAAGLRDGNIAEESLDNSAPFANHYEWSKWQAETLLAEREALPWQIFRVGTILCEDESGIVRQQNVIHNTLRLLYYGLLSVIPGHARTRIYMLSTEYAVNAIGRLLAGGDRRRVFHVSNGGDEAMTLGALLDTVYSSFMRDSKFARQGILKPRFCDQESFDTLVKSIDQFGGAMSQALGSVAPFAPQLYSDKNVLVDRCRSGLGDLRAPDTTALLKAACEHLVATRWGLKSEQAGARECA
jgi:nucleoside-diphosphate-sugar epimerase